MNDQVMHLLELVIKKNEINRRRRRFLFYSYKTFPRPRAFAYPSEATHLSGKEIEDGYRAARIEGRSLGKRLRYIREAMNAKFDWGNSGNILAIRLVDGRVIAASHFVRYYHELEAEYYLLRK